MGASAPAFGQHVAEERSAVEKFGEVLACGRSGDAGVAGEFGHGVRPAVYGSAFRRVPKRYWGTL